jgi:hypothetical protein
MDSTIVAVTGHCLWSCKANRSITESVGQTICPRHFTFSKTSAWSKKLGCPHREDEVAHECDCTNDGIVDGIDCCCCNNGRGQHRNCFDNDDNAHGSHRQWFRLRHCRGGIRLGHALPSASTGTGRSRSQTHCLSSAHGQATDHASTHGGPQSSSTHDKAIAAAQYASLQKSRFQRRQRFGWRL